MKPGTGAGRMRITRAPCSSNQSNSRDGAVDDAQRDNRSGENALLIVERPVLVHPLVEGVDHGMCRQRIVAQALLEQAGQRRPHQSTVDPELIHQLQPRFRIAESRNGTDRLAHDLPA